MTELNNVDAQLHQFDIFWHQIDTFSGQRVTNVRMAVTVALHADRAERTFRLAEISDIASLTRMAVISGRTFTQLHAGHDFGWIDFGAVCHDFSRIKSEIT